jgi:hypothetical protein
MIIEEAKPVVVLPATAAHFSLAAVTSILPTTIGNASAKVSSTSTPLNSMINH